MSAAPARVCLACHPAHRVGELRRVILSDPKGATLGEVSLDVAVRGAIAMRPAAAQLLAVIGPNRSDRSPTGDALHVVIGRRACFGYAIDADRVRWFSHPRLARADAFGALDDREIRGLLYDLHADDPDIVSEIIWETSGRIRAHRVPALPARIDSGVRGLLQPYRDDAAYWIAVASVLAGGAADDGRALAVGE